MQIICRKRLHFQDHEISTNSKTQEKVATVKQQVVVAPSVNPQQVPDWIKKTDFFNLCVDDGSITIVEVLSTPKGGGKGSKSIVASTEKKEETQASGWGAKPGAGLPNGNDLGSDGGSIT